MSGNIGNLGLRNVDSVHKIMMQAQIRIAKQDVGQNYARTMSMDVATGTVRVRTFGRPEIIL